MALLYAVVCGVGVFSNTVTYVSLRRTPPSTPGRTLLRHQCFLDAALCVAGFVLLTQTPMWYSGLPALDAVLCRLWHSEFIFSSLANVSLLILLLCVLDHMSVACSTGGSGNPGRRSELLRLLTVYVVGHFTCAPHLATVTFDGGKCLNRLSLPPGMDRLLCVAAMTMQLFPLVCVYAFLRRQCLRLSVTHMLNRKETREIAIYVFAVLMATLGFIIVVNLPSARHFKSMFSDKEVALAIVLSRSVFSTPGLAVSMSVDSTKESSIKLLPVDRTVTEEA
ncbi:hypothetical protein LSAT2_002019 [Lamellibrachia satsuma]|nr:hypothetical protein LSAT2_002019 [Lamellibrachia satsuma]